MTIEQQFAERDVAVRRFEYDDDVVLAADFGSVESAAVDVVDDTVIVVVDDEQYDVDVDGDAKAFIRNGVLTIEVSA